MVNKVEINIISILILSLWIVLSLVSLYLQFSNGYITEYAVIILLQALCMIGMICKKKVSLIAFGIILVYRLLEPVLFGYASSYTMGNVTGHIILLCIQVGIPLIIRKNGVSAFKVIWNNGKL